MSTKLLTYIAIISLGLIFATQAFLVFDYFQTTKAALSRESNTILLEVFRKELNSRHLQFKKQTRQDTITVLPPQEQQNSIELSVQSSVKKKNDVLGAIELALNSIVDKFVPMNIHRLDSITSEVLKLRDINSEYNIIVKNLINKQISDSSGKNTDRSLFLVSSSDLIVNMDNSKAIQLILINPFGTIVKRMSLMLISSLALTLLCLIAIRFLLKILARQKQLVAFKNEFLSTIAHELRRPVASLSFNLDCLSMPMFGDNSIQRDLMIHKSINATNELNDTIEMILALAKLEEGLLKLNLEPIDLKHMFEDIQVKMMNNSFKKIEIQLNINDEDNIYTGDKKLLTQCFSNLIDNSIKYSNDEVKIVASIRKIENYQIVSIKDNGIGMSEDKLAEIFNKYTRIHIENKKINGFGIGLNYVKTIIEKHNGTVDVKSKLGEGSEFIVSLPLS